ncbi:MAG: hypothetical protein QF752_04865 [Planctomycetota bacterium]|nr:hypothetical protein [Planctomycetota bacterium]
MTRTPFTLFLICLLLISLVGCQLLAFPIRLLTSIVQGLSAIIAQGAPASGPPGGVLLTRLGPSPRDVIHRLLASPDATHWPEVGQHLLKNAKPNPSLHPVHLLPLRDGVETQNAIQHLTQLVEQHGTVLIYPNDLGPILVDRTWRDTVRSQLGIPLLIQSPWTPQFDFSR